MRGNRTAASAAVIVAAAVLLSGGCRMPGSAEVFRNNSSPLVVEKGSEFIIALEANPTTGYSWQLAGEFDHAVLELEKMEYKPPATDRLGAGGEEKWTFKALEVGRTTLSFRCVRPWEVEGGDEGAEEKSDEHASGPYASAATGGQSEEVAAEEGEPEERAFIVDVVPKGGSGKEAERHGEADADKTLEVGLQTEFALALDSNPTTGYSWQLASYDQGLLYLVSREYEKKEEGGEEKKGEEGRGELVGAGGLEVFTFRAIAEGESEIELRYLRPWETDRPAEKTLTFQVEIKKEAEKEKKGH